MLKLSGQLGTAVLGALSAPPQLGLRGDFSSSGRSKLEDAFGESFWSSVPERVVVDFASGWGHEAIAAAQRGARHVYGIEIREKLIASGRELAALGNVEQICTFVNAATEPGSVQKIQGTADLVYSIDGFEHFREPESALHSMYTLLKPGGKLFIQFGPPWGHPYGAHMRYITRVPWVNYLFAEEAIMRVRSRYRDDGAKCFEETDGGLNRMTVARFSRLMECSSFVNINISLRPIRGLKVLAGLKTLREHVTSSVTCSAQKPQGAS